MKVLVVTRDLVGPVRNGGIGTACTSLVQMLKSEGHDVEILFALGTYSADGNFEYWKRYYTNKVGAKLIPMPMIGNIEAPPVQALSYMVYRWLMAHASDYDAIYSHEWRGLMFYPLLAKEQGLLPQDLRIIVGTHSPTMWVYDGNRQYPDGYDPLYTDYMERICVQLADEVVHPSQYIKDWIADWWGIKRGRVIQNMMPENAKEVVIPDGTPSSKVKQKCTKDSIDEIIFFGRFTTKKGVDVFCAALDQIEFDRPIAITFLGKDDMMQGIPASNYIRDKARLWSSNMRPNLLMDKDQTQAIKYLLAKENALIVVGSVFENLPYTVMEAIGLGKPIIVPENSGGTLELFRDPEKFTYERTPKGLAAKLLEAVEADKLPIPVLAVPQWEVKKQWLDLFEDIVTWKVRSTIEAQDMPTVSVCMAHYKRPDMIRVALESIKNQTYPRDLIQVVVTDDCSGPEYVEKLLKMQEEGLIDVLVKHQENKYLGAARNSAIEHATGKYVLIMDDDNVAKPREIEVLARAAEMSHADAVTVAMDKFTGALNPEYAEQKGLGLFLGGSVICGLTKNTYGDANGLYRREVLLENPYTEVMGVGFEDWELLATLAMKGYKVTHCPEPLFYYRLHPDNADSMLMSGNGYMDMCRMLRAYQSVISEANEELGKYLPMYVHGLQKAVFEANRDMYMMQQAWQQQMQQAQRGGGGPQILTP